MALDEAHGRLPWASTLEFWPNHKHLADGLSRPDATAAMIDAEGWLRTGDIGYADEDGYFY